MLPARLLPKNNRFLPPPPLLTTCWSQGAPFNNKAELIGDNRAYAGRVATAIAQITAFHCYPTEYWIDGIKYYPSLATLRNYKYGRDFTGNQVKRIISTYFRYIGNLLGNRWGYEEGTEASSEDAPAVFRILGYTFVSGLKGYDILTVINEINLERPVYMRAHGYHINNKSKESGHAWVVDGYKNLQLYGKTSLVISMNMRIMMV